ncbi:hypothetical protein ACFW5D_07440 [Streptomyces sp. NPDC058770]|uniref:hypothetical protein n=1 Tax=Streptomyces sp. NPDC058770 TaxID=3346631 RepID=UPI0036A7BB2C
MTAAQTISGVHAFRKYHSGQQRKSPINKALFETIAVNLAGLAPEQRDRLRQLDALDAFADLMEDTEFERSISVATGDPKKVRKRFEAVQELFEDLLDHGDA